MRTACVVSAMITMSVCAAPSLHAERHERFSFARTEMLSITPPTAIAVAPDRAPDASRDYLSLLCVDLDFAFTRLTIASDLLASPTLRAEPLWLRFPTLSSALED